jgi:hypothetical protein
MASGRLAGLCAALAAAGCQSVRPEPQAIRVGMTKAEVLASLGRPAEVRGPAADAHGRMAEIWHYRLEPEVASGGDVAKGVLTSGIGFFDDPSAGHRYRFVFVDERLASWGPDR